MLERISRLVTIIIPIYNLDKYLYRCLESVKSQDYQDIEVILVDDGSTDKSKEICYEFLNNDNRFKYFFQQNSGVSKARNYGICQAQGTFLTFVDGDDYLEPDHISSMVHGMSNANVDVVISGRRIITAGEDKLMAANKKQFRTQEELIKDSFSQLVYGYIWNKLYKAKIIKDNHVFFLESLSFAEDQVFNISYFKCSAGGLILDKATYNYVRRQDSITKGRTKYAIEGRLTMLKASKIVIDLLKDSNQYQDQVKFLYFKIARDASTDYSFMSQLSFSKREMEDCKKTALDAYKRSYDYMSIAQRLRIKMYLTFPKTVRNIIKTIKR